MFDWRKKRAQSSSRQKQLKGPELLGRVKKHPDGFGFFIPEQKDLDDCYIPRRSLGGAMSNDRVRARIGRRRGDRSYAQVTQIVERHLKQVVGKWQATSDSWGVIADSDGSWGEDLKVYLGKFDHLKDGAWVVARVLSYPDHIKGFSAEVVGVLKGGMGAAGDNERVLYEHQVPQEFSAECLAQARALGQVEPGVKDFRLRKDLRDKNFVTIDGVTAQDYDDAIYVESTPSGGFKLYVAIADVSHYVKPGDPVDKDAYARGTSTYFPRFVNPMLPEALSNNLCSLVPHKPRLVLVSETHLDAQACATHRAFYEGVICSKARLTYGRVQGLLDGDAQGEAFIVEPLLRAQQLAQRLAQKRYKEGSLNLEIPESIVRVNELGEPVDVLRSARLFSHKLIEELMLRANVSAAEFLAQKGYGVLYRVHEPPKSEELEILQAFLKRLGAAKNLDKNNLQHSLTQALQNCAGMPEERILHILTLRCMNQAVYSSNNKHHFGLGFEHYTHFTSPIRRYPDLIVHRVLKSALGVEGYSKLADAYLQTAGTVLSACEQRSVKAERQLVSIKKARFMQQFVGQDFEALVSKAAPFGVFVSVRQYDCEGLVPMSELPGYGYEFDEKSMSLRSPKGAGLGNIRVGDAFKVRLTSVDVAYGFINFALDDKKASPSGREARCAKGPRRGRRRKPRR